MPVAIQADRPLVQALILQGFTPAQVARKTGLNAGTVKTWAHRYGWNRAVADTATMLTQRRSPDLAVRVAQKSVRVREVLAGDLEQQADRLTKRNHGRTIKDARDRAELAKTLVDASEKLFQWSQQSSSQLVSVETLIDLESSPMPTVTAPLPAASETVPDTSASQSCIEVEASTQEPIDPSI